MPVPVLDHGVVPPLCTPLTPERELDVPSLERLTGFLLDAGVHGLFVTGSTGEVAYLPDDLRHRALDVVVRCAAGQVPVLAGIVDTTTPRVLAHAHAAETHGAQALVATAPFYAPTAPSEFPTHFRAIRAAVDLPLIAYDIPGSVHAKLPAEVLAGLAQDGTLDGLKDSSGDLDGLRTVLESVGTPHFRVFTGSETMADIAMFLGAHGLVPGLGNVDPHGYVRLYEAARRGDWKAAATEQRRLRELWRMITVGGGRIGPYASAIGAFKYALVARGVLAHGTTSLPMAPLHGTEQAAVRELLAAAGLSQT
ncbi:dihydrodipicolinate synthase family protein [Amycolatopsis acidiphila]|uniref:Dihydrodipicolinate synthase family protein n=1 Tax=Amycolatopsis acidiphila TaxID=715473 RepID=A0A557ZWB9_9PSEU|nr:dihydrodipicolinate synthase family protein [Amycolatopsis acidiphila]TVT16295.1 dihydrodipicolinate synthase family protein [Amycolatopsis acidiphila]UIJ56825.1 dihydrodipicolinate synthase family protein [Amycolatopsis acidiphila]GHG54924.1 dihydrodipicolinate synthase family protein [Amycolatopsis acidiphila]